MTDDRKKDPMSPIPLAEGVEIFVPAGIPSKSDPFFIPSWMSEEEATEHRELFDEIYDRIRQHLDDEDETADADFKPSMPKL